MAAVFRDNERVIFIKKLSIYMLILSIVITLLAGCSTNSAPTIGNGLEITSLQTSLGGNEDNLDEQVYSYELYLTNYDDDEVLISSIEPVLVDELAQKVISKNLVISVNKTIAPKKSLGIKGSITLDTRGLTKEEIVELQPFDLDFKVVSQRTLKVNGK